MVVAKYNFDKIAFIQEDEIPIISQDTLTVASCKPIFNQPELSISLKTRVTKFQEATKKFIESQKRPQNHNVHLALKTLLTVAFLVTATAFFIFTVSFNPALAVIGFLAICLGAIGSGLWAASKWAMEVELKKELEKTTMSLITTLEVYKNQFKSKNEIQEILKSYSIDEKYKDGISTHQTALNEITKLEKFFNTICNK